ncbi:MAG: hypothetical protein ACI9X0_000342 [Kiritimatiellia bacterium]|jgi:hypothetical protein
MPSLKKEEIWAQSPRSTETGTSFRIWQQLDAVVRAWPNRPKEKNEMPSRSVMADADIDGEWVEPTALLFKEATHNINN